MYCLPEMIDFGLKDGQKWPSKAHRNVAIVLCIANPHVRTRDALIEICQKVMKIPGDKIEHVDWANLPMYDIPLIASPG